MRGAAGVILALSLAEHATAFALLNAGISIRGPEAVGAGISIRGPRAVGSQSARMLVGVPKEVLVTGAAGKTGCLTFVVRHALPIVIRGLRVLTAAMVQECVS